MGFAVAGARPPGAFFSVFGTCFIYVVMYVWCFLHPMGFAVAGAHPPFCFFSLWDFVCVFYSCVAYFLEI